MCHIAFFFFFLHTWIFHSSTKKIFLFFLSFILCSIFIPPGWTGEKVCLVGDSAGGNLSVTTSMRAAAFGVRMPDGIVAVYPATLLTAYASPSRLLTLMDPLLPLSVLSRCLSAYTGRCVCVLNKAKIFLLAGKAKSLMHFFVSIVLLSCCPSLTESNLYFLIHPTVITMYCSL